MTIDAYRLGVDFGTSTTVAVLSWPDGSVKPLVFDGSELLPSAVCVDVDGTLLAGRDALHAARSRPEGFEPNPKRCVDDGVVLLGGVEVAIPELFAAVLRRVAVEARRVSGRELGSVTLACPAGWGQRRRDVLTAAAGLAGLGTPELVAEPVAAASQFVDGGATKVPAGSYAVVYDLGAGTFDAAVVRRTADGFEVVAEAGLADAGGLDIDEAVVAYLGSVYVTRDAGRWARLHQPATAEDRRVARALREDVRTGKEVLSRASSTLIRLPLFDDDAPLGREQLDLLARPILDRTVRATRAVLDEAGVGLDAVAGLFLVGGSTRMPLVASLLHRTLGLAPTVVDRPELVVAEGSLRAPTPTPAVAQETAAPLRPVAQETAAPVRLAAEAAAPLGPVVEETAAQVGPVAEEAARPVAPPRVPEVRPGRVEPPPPAEGERRRRVGRRGLLAAAITAPVVAVLPIIVNEVRSRRDDSGARQGSSPPAQTPAAGPTASATAGPPRRTATLAGAGAPVAFSPDGHTVATTGADYTVLLWDLTDPAKPRKTATIAPDVASVNAVDFSPDGRTLGIAGQGTQPGLWDVSDRARPVRTASLSGFATGVYDLEFSTDGRTLATSSLKAVVLWNIANRARPVRRANLTDFTGSVGHVTFSGRGLVMATVDAAPALILWEFDKDPIPHRMGTIAIPGGNDGLAWSPNPRTLATSANDTTTLWNVLDRRRPVKLATVGGRVAHFSPDGETLATVSRAGSVQLFDVDDAAKPVRTHTLAGEDARFGPDGFLAVTGAGGVQLWKL